AFVLNDKLTLPISVTLRVTDAHGVSSADGTEESMTVRSGRLKLFNSFGSDKLELTLPMQTQYWSGRAWVLNGADSCTSISVESVVRAQYLDHKGAATTAWTTTPSGVLLSNGHG